MARYCPASNNQHPFDHDPQPEAFELTDLPRYLDSIPVGLSELTDEGAVVITKEAYSWRTDVPRTFVVRSEDGESAALIEIDGKALAEPNLNAYLNRHATHLTGADVRELGRIGAVIVDLILRQYYPDEALSSANVLAWDRSLDKGSILNVKQTKRSVPVRDGIRRLQFTATVPKKAEIVRAAAKHTHAGDWDLWEQVAREFPRTIASGQVPLGIACFRPKDGVSLSNGGKWVTAAKACLSFDRHDIVCVTTPQGHAVLMCLDTQHAVANCEPGEEHLQPALQWLAQELPEQLLAAHASQPYALLYGHTAVRLINDNLGVRGRRPGQGIAGITADYPLITREDGSFYPMVLDAVFVPTEACIHDILNGQVLGSAAAIN